MCHSISQLDLKKKTHMYLQPWITKIKDILLSHPSFINCSRITLDLKKKSGFFIASYSPVLSVPHFKMSIRYARCGYGVWSNRRLKRVIKLRVSAIGASFCHAHHYSLEVFKRKEKTKWTMKKTNDDVNTRRSNL